MSEYEVKFYIGQKIGDLEVTLIQDTTVQLLCKCGNVLARKIGSTIPMQCKDCAKVERSQSMRSKSDTSLIIRDLTPEEQLMIEKFKRSQNDT